jgi:type IV pilus assembly protein PilC
VICLALCLVWAVSRTSASARRVVVCIPLLGALLRWSSLCRFSQLLALLMEHRVPMSEAVWLAGDACGDAAIRQDCRSLAARVAAGETFETAVLRVRSFPRGYTRGLALRSNQPWFPDTQRALAEIYAARIRALMVILATLLPGFVILVAAGLFALVVVAIFMPLIQLLNALA